MDVCRCFHVEREQGEPPDGRPHSGGCPPEGAAWMPRPAHGWAFLQPMEGLCKKNKHCFLLSKKTLTAGETRSRTDQTLAGRNVGLDVFRLRRLISL